LADHQGKHSLPRAQGRRRAHAAIKPPASPKAKASPKPKVKTHKPRIGPHRSPRRAKKRERIPPSLRFTETKRGKTTIRRYPGRTFYRFAEAAGKPVDLVEVFTAGGYHSIDVRFQDKTAMHFFIEPGFTLEGEYADWKTGDCRLIKRLPLIRSATLRT
jgi:hypothetical protein